MDTRPIRPDVRRRFQQLLKRAEAALKEEERRLKELELREPQSERWAFSYRTSRKAHGDDIIRDLERQREKAELVWIKPARPAEDELW